jgi:predicted porin
MAATQNFGTGVSALLSLPVSSRYSAVVSTGFMSFSGDVLSAGEGTKYRRANIFPLRGGLNYKLTPTFYTTTQLGYASARYLGQSQGGFSQGIGLGFFNGRFDVGAIWDHHYVHGGLGSINLKLGYAIFGRHNRF